MNIAEQIYALFHPRIRFVILSIIIAEIDKFFLLKINILVNHLRDTEETQFYQRWFNLSKIWADITQNHVACKSN